MQPSNRQLPNGGVVSYDQPKLDETANYVAFTVPHTADVKMSTPHAVPSSVASLSTRPYAPMPGPPFLFRAPLRSTSVNQNVVNLRNVGQIEAQRIVHESNNQYTIFVNQNQAMPQIPGAGHTYTQIGAQGHPQAYPSPPFYLTSYQLPANSFLTQGAPGAQVPGAPWQTMGAVGSGAVPMFAPSMYTVPTAVASTSMVQPTNVVPPLAATGINHFSTEPLPAKEKKILAFIDPVSNKDVMKEVINENKAQPQKSQIHPGGTVYYAQQQAQASAAPAQSAPVCTISADSAPRPTTTPLSLSNAAQPPLVAAKSNCSTDAASVASRVATAVQVSAASPRPKPSSSPAVVANAPDENRKNLIYNELALNIAQAAGQEATAPVAEVVIPAQQQNMVSAPETGVSFGFFDDSGLAGSTTPTPETSPQKVAIGTKPTESSLQISFMSVQQFTNCGTTSAVMIDSTCTTTASTIIQTTDLSVELDSKDSSMPQNLASDETIKRLIEPELLKELESKKIDGSWFYTNTVGNRIYNRDYMLAVSNVLSAGKCPDFSAVVAKELLGGNGRNIVSFLMEKARTTSNYDDAPDARCKGFNVDWQLPPSTRRPPSYSTRNSTGGGGGGGRGSQGSQRRAGATSMQQAPMIIPRPSLTAPEVQLKRADNAWKPMRKQLENKDPETVKTETLNRDVKLILNKITPQSFDELAAEFFALHSQMDTEARIMGVIDILFTKVCDEPAFSEIYGQLCEHFRNQQVCLFGQEQKKSQIRVFSYYLLMKCQRDFEKENTTETYRDERLAVIESAESEEKVRLKSNLEEDLVKFKWRTLGSVRFIGELYKRSLLTRFITYLCIKKLLEKITHNHNDEETIECLCKFLATIGKMFELDKSQSKDKSKVIPEMFIGTVINTLINVGKGPKVRKRSQFEIQNLIEMRDNNWTPRRRETGPMKIHEVHSEAQLEELNKRVEFEQMSTSRKQYQQHAPPYYMQRGSRGSMPQQKSSHANLSSSNVCADYEDSSAGSRKKFSQGGRPSQDRPNRSTGRQPVASGSSGSYYDQPTRPIDTNSLSKHTKNTYEEMTLGPPRRRWNNQKSATVANSSPISLSNNKFAHLCEEDGRQVKSSSPSRDPSQNASDRQAVLEAVGQLHAKPPPVPQSGQATTAKLRADAPSSGSSCEASLTRPRPAMSGDELRSYANTLVDEYVVSEDHKEAVGLVQEQLASATDIVRFSLEHVVEKRDTDRVKFAQLVVHLMSGSVIRKQHLVDAFEQFIVSSIDNGLDTDVPLLWHYVGSILGSICAKSNVLRLSDFHSCFQAAGDSGRTVLGSLMGIMNASNLAEVFAGETWSDYGFPSPKSVSDFLKHYKLPDSLLTADSLFCDTDVHHNNDKPTCGGVKLTRGIDKHCKESTESLRTVANVDPELVLMERHIADTDSAKPDNLIEWIINNVKNVHTEDFSSALTKSLCSKVFTILNNGENTTLFKEHFEQYCRVFQRFISGHPNLEKALLTMLAWSYYKNNCPKDAFVTMLESLSSTGAMPRETFLEWWQTELDKSASSGMIKKNNHVITFFESLKRQQEATTVSKS